MFNKFFATIYSKYFEFSFQNTFPFLRLSNTISILLISCVFDLVVDITNFIFVIILFY